MLKNVLKFSGILAGITVLGFAALFGIEYVRYWWSPEYRAEQELEDLKKQYMEDTYGGETPEETLALFIDALKAGDTDLAAKYFVLDKQEEWREDLAKIKEKNLLDEMIKELESAKYTDRGDVAFFTIVDKENIATSELIMHKNPLNNKWKITEL